MEIVMVRSPHGALLPSSDMDADSLRRIKVGTTVRCQVTRMRNGQFHRKFFALCHYLFGLWSEFATPATYRGHRIEPNFDRFRRDLTVLAGFYTLVPNIRGEVRVEAKSISFANMDQAEFEELYSKVIDVALQKVLTKGVASEESIREAVESVMRFS